MGCGLRHGSEEEVNVKAGKLACRMSASRRFVNQPRLPPRIEQLTAGRANARVRGLSPRRTHCILVSVESHARRFSRGRLPANDGWMEKHRYRVAQAATSRASGDCGKSSLENDLQLWRRSSVGQSSGIIIRVSGVRIPAPLLVITYNLTKTCDTQDHCLFSRSINCRNRP